MQRGRRAGAGETTGTGRTAPFGSVAPGLNVYRSNRTEKLVDALAEVVRQAQDDGNPLRPEWIAVQGRGMERWLSMELARRLGVWANPRFPFPRRLIENVLAAAPDNDKEAAQRFQPEVLTWSVAALLPQCQERPEFAPIRHYLQGDDSLVRRVQLAQRIAHTLDDYVVFRPEMVLEWERGQEVHWQAHLWRQIVEMHGSHHVAARARRFIEAAADVDLSAAGLPERLSLFGLSTLAPLHLDVLVALSARIPLYLFVLSPSPEYWASIRSRRESLRDPKIAAAPDLDEELREREGNPLLASFGQVGREFQGILEERAHYHDPDVDLYVKPAGNSMLSRLQADMFDLISPGSRDVSRLDVDALDESILVHACHGPMREVEVLHDQLRDLFEKDPTLEPQHVIVMSPSIDAYAPYIDAVFGTATDGRDRVPYRVADRRVRATEEITDTFLNLLGVLRGRMRAPEVMDLLEREAVRERFGIAAEELDLVRTWIRESGVRWGVDGEHRSEEQQPPLPQNTWRFGLDRLLLGHAMAGDGRRLYAGVLPYDDVEGTTTELLGRVAEFCDQIFAWRAKLRDVRRLDEWSRDLAALLEAMLASVGSNEHQHQQIRDTLDALARRAGEGRFDEPLGLDLVRSLLEAEVEGSAPGRNFLTGGVTFCALVPMRSIPFRVVCLLGLNDAEFPRVQRPAGFDLIAREPRPGDRSVRNDDRQLFLEAVLAARDRLVITYFGQSIRDNTEIPPSVAVSELLDVIESSFYLPDRPAAVGHAVSAGSGVPDTGGRHPLRRHPLQPFSPANFRPQDDAPVFSYARHAVAGARALVGEATPAPRFLDSPLPAEDGAGREVDLDDLVRFFEHPARAFLKRRLRLHLGRDSEALDDRQPLELDSLEEWEIGDELLRRAVRREDLDATLRALGASGRVPPGVLGEVLHGELCQQVERLALAARQRLGDAPLAPQAFAKPLDETTLRGTIANAWPQATIQYQFSKLGGRQEIGVWIRHLVLNWLQLEGYPRQSYLVGRPPRKGQSPMVGFRPVADAGAHLAELLHLYRLGQRCPLPLFARASRRYAERLRHGDDPAVALAAAHDTFSDQSFGEGNDEYVLQAFTEQDPLAAELSVCVDDASDRALRFTELAETVFVPLLEHREPA